MIIKMIDKDDRLKMIKEKMIKMIKIKMKMKMTMTMTMKKVRLIIRRNKKIPLDFYYRLC